MITLDRLNKGNLFDKGPERKKCNRCGEEKDIKDFRKTDKMKYGRSNTCRDCETKRKKERDAQKEKYAEKFFDPKTPAF